MSGEAWFYQVEFLLDEVSKKAEDRTLILRGRVEELQANLDAVTDENRQLRERVTELELVTVAGVAERVTHLESKSAGSTSAGSQPASAAAEQQPAPAAAAEQPPPPPLNQMQVVPFRAHPCPKCRHATGPTDALLPSCEVVALIGISTEIGLRSNGRMAPAADAH